jgi:excisionase family DNA binding protein
MVDPRYHGTGGAQADSVSAGCGKNSPRAFRISEVCSITGLGRTTIYAAIKAGHLTARKYRRRTIVLADDLTAWLASLPPKAVRQ